MLRKSSDSNSKGAVIVFMLFYASILLFLLLLGHYHGFYLIGWTLLTIIFASFFIPLFKSDKNDFPWLMERDDRILRLIFFFTAFSLRAIFLLDIPSEENRVLSEDLLKYSNKARRVKNGKLPHRDFDTAYGPFHNYLIAIASLFATKGPDSKPFVWDYDLIVVLMFKLLACICDSVNSVLVFEIGRLWNLTRDRATLCAFGYALNPLSVIELGWMGHNDALVIMLMLLSLYAYLRDEDRSSAILLATATTMKYWPGFCMLLFVGSLLAKENGYYRSAIYILTFIVTGILISLPFLLLTPIDFVLAVISLAEGGGNIYDRLSFLALATDIVMKGLLRSEDEELRNLIKMVFSILFYLVVLSFISAFALARRYPQRLSMKTIFNFAYIAVLVLLAIWGIVFAFYAVIVESPLIIFGIAMFLTSVWFLKSDWEVIVTTLSFSSTEQSITAGEPPNPSDPLVEAIMWTGFLLVLTNATFHSWYYTWFLPVLFLMLGKKPSYTNLMCLIFLHQPTSYIRTKLYFRSFWP